MTREQHDKLHQMIYRHDWACLDDWVDALNELAELSDDEVEELTKD